jgi:hypothetical protein
MQETNVDPTTLPWLRTAVREVVRLRGGEEIDTRTLRELGARSVHVVALQFRIFQETSVNLEVHEMVGDSPVAELAALIDGRRPA